jgi:MFS family permease
MEGAPPPPRRRRLFLIRHREFSKLWAGQAISTAGSAVTTVAMPLAAVVVLHASPVQMGMLAALTTLPHLLFGLVAGVWVDRLPRRTIMVVADVARAALLGCVPVLGVLGVLRMEHLYTVAFLAGVMTLLFEVAAMSLIPLLVGPDDLVEANSAWLLHTSVATTAGPSVAGWLVQVLTAPVAIAVDAVSFLLSAACSMLVRLDGAAAVAPERGRVRLWAEIVEGLGTLFSHRVLAAVTVSATVGALGGAMYGALVVLFLVRYLHLGPALVGLAVAASGVAAVAGTLLTPSLTRRLGPGPTYIVGQVLASVAGLLLALAQGPAVVVAVLVGLGQLAVGAGLPLFSVSQRTLRQALVPRRLLGRANATWRFLVFGAQPLGALLGGALASAATPRVALIVGSAGMLLGTAWGARSPLRGLRRLP